MNPNVRTGLIALFFVVLAVGVVWLFGGDDNTEVAEEAPAPAVESEAPDHPSGSNVSLTPARTGGGTSGPAPAQDTGPSGGAQTVERSERLFEGPYAIFGTVVMPNGSPASGAAVRVLRFDRKEHVTDVDKHLAMDLTADTEGKFNFENLSEGGYTVWSMHEGFFAAERTHVSNWTSAATVQLRLEAKGSVSGKVVNLSGEPVAHAVVYPVRQNEEDKDASLRTDAHIARTDASGSFQIPGLPDSVWKLAAMAKGHPSGELENVRTGETEATITLEGAGTVSGIVIDDRTREPVEGVKISMRRDKMYYDRHDVESGADGAFVFDSLMDGEYYLGIDDELRVITHKVEKVAVAAGTPVEGLELRVVDGGTITGRIYDKETGRGIPGISISANAQFYDEDRPTPGREAESEGRDGRFELTGLGETTYRLYMNRDLKGYQSRVRRANVAVKIGEVIDGIDFALEKGLSLSGRVVDKQQNPVSGAQVTGRGQGSERDTTRTGSNGYFSLSGFGLTEVHVWAVHGEMQSKVMGPYALFNEAKDDVTIVLDLAKTCTIAGEVVDSQGRGLPGMNVQIRGELSNYAGTPTATTGENGQFESRLLTPGTYTLSANYPNQWQNNATYPEPVILKDGEHRDGIRLVMDSGNSLTISGNITDTRGEPLQGANVNAWSSSTGSQSYTHTEEDGTYELPNLVEGEYQVSANHHLHTEARLEDIPAGSRNIDFALPGSATVSGFVRDGATGNPVEEFDLYVVRDLTTTLPEYMTSQGQRYFDPEGAFEWRLSHEGETTVFARAEGYAPGYAQVNAVVAESSYDDLIITLEEGVRVEGRVVNSDGEPVPQTHVYIGALPDEWRRTTGAVAVADAYGAFVVEGIGREERTLTAWHPLYSAATERVPFRTSQAVEVEFVLVAGGTIVGRVTEGGKAPASNVYLNYRGADNDPHYHPVDPDGTYEINGLSPGNYTVDAYMEQGGQPNRNRNLERAAVVASKQETVVDFDFPAMDASMEGAVRLRDKPATSGYVYATAQTPDGEETYRGDINDRGFYRIEAMASGAVNVRVRASNEDASGGMTINIQVASGETHKQDFELSPYIRVTGTVTGGQGPLRGVSAYRGHVTVPDLTPASLAELDTLREDRHTSNNTIGPFEYQLDLTEPGDYTLSAYSLVTSDAEGLRNASFQTMFITVEEGESLTVDINVPE